MKFPALSPRMMILLDQAIFSGTSFIITLLVARATNVEDFGIYSGYVLGIYLAVSAVGAWVIQPFQVLLGQIDDRNGYTSFIVWLQLFLTLLVCLIALGIIALFVEGIPLTVILYAAGFMFHDFGRKLLLALDRPLPTLLSDTVASIGMLAAAVIFYSFGEGDVYTLMLYFFFAYLVPGAMILIYSKPFQFDSKQFPKYIQLHVKEGKWLFSTALVQWWSGNLFVVASGVYLGAAALGALRLGQSLFGVLNVLLQTFENYVLPQTAQRMRESRTSAVHYLASVTRKSALLFLPVLVLTFVFDETIMKLAGGSSYESYGYVLQGLTLLYVFIFFSQPVRMLVRSLLLNQHFFYGYVLSLVFALVVSPVLLGNFELMGAIAGLILSQFILIVYWSFVLRTHNLKVWKSFMSF